MMILYCYLLLAILTTQISVVKSEDELIMANVIYRHGARSPMNFYPTNPHKDDWPDGAHGRLTQNGMYMEYELGGFLKARYVDTSFVNQSYLHNEVFIKSSGVDRALQSAASQLAALYPPQGYQIWNPAISWQPIPIQTVPTHQDPVILPEKTDCPRLFDIVNQMRQEPEYIQKGKDNQELFDYMSEHSGMTITFQNMWHVTDASIAERAQGLKNPIWVDARYEEMTELSNWQFVYGYHGSSQELARLLGGTLLGIIINNMESKVTGQNHKKQIYKLNMYSGHDTTILSTSTALNIKINEAVAFASAILIELYKTANGDYYVTMNYRNESNHLPYQWQLDSCDYRCPLSDFVRLTLDRIPTDRKAECLVGHENDGVVSKHNTAFFTKTHLKIISLILLTITLLLAIAHCWMCRKKSSNVNIYAKATNKDTKDLDNGDFKLHFNDDKKSLLA